MGPTFVTTRRPPTSKVTTQAEPTFAPTAGARSGDHTHLPGIPRQSGGGEAEACPDVLGADDAFGAVVAVAVGVGLGPGRSGHDHGGAFGQRLGYVRRALSPNGGLVELGLGVQLGAFAVLPSTVHRDADPAYRGSVG